MPDTQDEVFVCYAHEDRLWKDRLMVHLRGLEKAGKLRVWQDGLLVAGDRWRGEIAGALRRARVAVLLVSPSFLESDFIQGNELRTVLDRAARGSLRLVWIPVSPSVVAHTVLTEYQAALEPGDYLARHPDENDYQPLLSHLAGRIVEALALQQSTAPGGGAPPAKPPERWMLEATLPRSMTVRRPYSLIVLMRPADSVGLSPEPSHQIGRFPFELDFPEAHRFDAELDLDAPHFSLSDKLPLPLVLTSGSGHQEVFSLSALQPGLLTLKVRLRVSGASLGSEVLEARVKDRPKPPGSLLVSAELSLTVSAASAAATGR
jgi:hypothetical protein